MRHGKEYRHRADEEAGKRVNPQIFGGPTLVDTGGPVMAAGAGTVGSASFAYQKTLTIQASQIDASLTNYVAWIRLSGDADVHAHARSDFNDIRFLDSGGGTLAHELAYRKSIAFGGVWSWFSNPRAIYANGVTYYSYVRQTGAVSVKAYVHATGASAGPFALGTFEQDDHNNAGLYYRSDGKILAMYCRHNADATMRYRITSSADNISAWAAESTVTLTGTTAASYAQVRYISSVGKLLCFFRSDSRRWKFIVSTDEGSTWGAPQSFIDAGAGQQMYLLATTNGSDRIDIVMTDGHPSDVTDGNTSVYHCYIKDVSGTLTWYKSDGTSLGSAEISVSSATQIVAYDNGGVAGDWWINDIAIDNNSAPVVLLQKGDESTLHEYYYGIYSGGSWTLTKVANAGATLGDNAEVDYFGGQFLSRSDASRRTLWVVTTPDSSTRVFNIFKYIFNGSSFTSTQITTIAEVQDDATAGKVQIARPVSPENQPAGHRLDCLFWHGVYNNYTSINTDISGYPWAIGGAYVKVPSVDASVDTDVKMQYGSPSQETSLEDKDTCWFEYYFVHHMKTEPGTLWFEESRTGTRANQRYATRTVTLTNTQTASYDDYLGGGVNFFSGVTTICKVKAGTVNLAGATALTAYVLAKPSYTGSAADNRTLLSNWSVTKGGFLLRINGTGSGTGVIDAFALVQTDTSKSVADYGSANSGVLGSFGLACDTTDLRAQVNGAESSATATGAALDADTSLDTQIGSSPHQAADEYAGLILEARLASRKWSAAEHKATHVNYTDYTSFIATGTEVAL